MSDQVWFFATRAAGLMTWSTASASVLVGLLLLIGPVQRRSEPWGPRLRGFLSSVSLIFLVTHLGTLWLDSVMEFGWRELVIPGESSWKPDAAAWGVVAAWALIVVQIAFLFRNHLGAVTTRALHVVAVLTVAAGSYHAWLGGTDTREPLTWIVAGAGSVIVVVLIAVRLRRSDDGGNTSDELSDRESILVEMRERLESLPVPESAAPATMAFGSSSTLPRRAPVAPAPASTALDHAPPTPAGAVGTVGTDEVFGEDPFASVPLGDESPGIGGWVGRSSSDPFPADGIDPFRNNATPAHTDSAALGSLPVSESAPFGTPAPPTPFSSEKAASPFGSEAPPPPPIAVPKASPIEEDLFGPATSADAGTDDFPELPAFEPGRNPFSPVDPPSPAISVLVDTTPAATTATGPPPLPDQAMDPQTGKPDEAAYTAWLVEWLAYAERYGEETPEDPKLV